MIRFDVVCFSEILNAVVLDGVTGNVAFNDEGDRIESLYEVINIQNDRMTTVGTYRTNTVRKFFIRSTTFSFVFSSEHLFHQRNVSTNCSFRQIFFWKRKKLLSFFFADRKNGIDVGRKSNHLAQRKSSKTRWNSNSTKCFGSKKIEHFRLFCIFISFRFVSFEKVVTIEEKPFIFSRRGNDCQAPLEVFCPRKKLNGKTTLFFFS